METALKALVERVEPTLVIASGDLTHRGRRSQHDEAAAFLRRLGTPLLVVPGNHDIPLTLPSRFTHPWREFERHWETTTADARDARTARRRSQLGAAVAAPVRRDS